MVGFAVQITGLDAVSTTNILDGDCALGGQVL
jgi:hypothetical protein